MFLSFFLLSFFLGCGLMLCYTERFITRNNHLPHGNARQSLLQPTNQPSIQVTLTNSNKIDRLPSSNLHNIPPRNLDLPLDPTNTPPNPELRRRPLRANDQFEPATGEYCIFDTARVRRCIGFVSAVY